MITIDEKKRVLIVDDEVILTGQLSNLLEEQEFITKVCNSSLNVFQELDRFNPDVALIDKEMPHINGIDIAKKIRISDNNSTLPIIMITGNNSKELKLEAFNVGIDDFITKPFDTDFLIERIRVLYDRSSRTIKNNNKNKEKIFGNLEIDVLGYSVKVNNQEVSLTISEFNILKKLLDEIDKVRTRKVLCEDVLGKKFVDIRTVDVHIASLRKKLGSFGSNIKTVRGAGYKVTLS